MPPRHTSPSRRAQDSSAAAISSGRGHPHQQQQQFLTNEDTGRAIRVNGPTYHKLLAQGYQVRALGMEACQPTAHGWHMGLANVCRAWAQCNAAPPLHGCSGTRGARP